MIQALFFFGEISQFSKKTLGLLTWTFRKKLLIEVRGRRIFLRNRGWENELDALGRGSAVNVAIIMPAEIATEENV